MNNKEFIENRTLDDIMESYDEQREEWVTELVVKDGNVISFRHKNGKIFYCKQCDSDNSAYNVSDEIRAISEGKTIEQQMEHFYVTSSYKFYSTAYGEITKEDVKKYSVKLSEYNGVKNLLLKDKILIGATIKSWCDEGDLLLNNPVCTYYTSDNEGSGTKERDDYAYLIYNATLSE